MQRQIPAELDYLKQIVPDAAASFAFSHMVLYLGLLAQVHKTVDVIRQRIPAISTKHDFPATESTGFLGK
jgi:hypothetical protein